MQALETFCLFFIKKVLTRNKMFDNILTEKQNVSKKGEKMRINWISDSWVRVKNHCRTTVNKEFTDNIPSSEFKTNLLISEHSQQPSKPFSLQHFALGHTPSGEQVAKEQVLYSVLQEPHHWPKKQWLHENPQ